MQAILGDVPFARAGLRPAPPERDLDTNNRHTTERYNELCEKGHDDDFFKRADQMVPVRDAPFYGARVGGRFLTVMGGLRTNVDLQVCQDDDTPIEGLYVVGTMVGDFFNNTYTFLMEGLNYGGCCVTFGYVLGRELAAK